MSSSLLRLKKWEIFTSSLKNALAYYIQWWRCGCKFKSRRIGSSLQIAHQKLGRFSQQKLCFVHIWNGPALAKSALGKYLTEKPRVGVFTHGVLKVGSSVTRLGSFFMKNIAQNSPFWGGQRPLVPLLLLGPPFFTIILFGSTTLLTGMTGISLHMQWPLTSQLHGSVSQREQLFFLLGIKLHALIRLGVSPPSFDTGARNGVLCGSQLSH
jgi:hypothetical protein